MEWKHKCDLNWLRERRNYLTATDIKDLIPVTKTGRARKITNADYLKVFSRKDVGLTPDDCISKGAAARGHLLEPYALISYNKYYKKELLWHWDDKLITDPNDSRPIAFSPDACDKVQPDTKSVVLPPDGITMIGEIKSYSPEKHMLCGYTDKMDLEERWQIATAMVVSADIRKAKLIFYNPSMGRQTFVHEYTRKDLIDEIAIIDGVIDSWVRFLDDLKSDNIECNSKLIYGMNDFEYNGIIPRIEKSYRINPE